jgi:hypothetical protein
MAILTTGNISNAEIAPFFELAGMTKSESYFYKDTTLWGMLWGI